MPQTAPGGTKRPNEDKPGGSPSNKRRTDIPIPTPVNGFGNQASIDALQQWQQQQQQHQQDRQFRMAMIQPTTARSATGIQPLQGAQQGPSLSQFQNLYFNAQNAASSPVPASDPNSLPYQSSLMLGNLHPAHPAQAQDNKNRSTPSSAFYPIPYNVAQWNFGSSAPGSDPHQSPLSYQTALHASPMEHQMALFPNSQSLLQLSTNQAGPSRPPSVKQGSKQSTTAAVGPSSSRSHSATRPAQSAPSTQDTADDDEEDDAPPAGHAPEGKEKLTRWSVKEIIELVDWVFADPERIVQVANHPSRLFAKAVGVICTTHNRPHRALKDRFRRLMEQRKLINEYDAWVRANNLDPTVHDLPELEKRLERARQNGVKLPALTPRAVKLWVRNDWLEQFNKYFPLDGSRSHAIVQQLGTITPALSGGGLPDTGYISDDSESEDETVLGDPQSQRARFSRFTPPSSSISQARPLPPESPLRPPVSVAISAPTPQEPTSPLIRIKSPLSSTSALALPYQKGETGGKDRVDRGITVALGILSQQSAEPALKRKATDFLSKILDEAAQDMQ